MKRKIETSIIEPVKRLKITGAFSETILEKVTNEDLDNGYFNCPEGITEIEINAFKRCINLRHITWPYRIKQFGEGPFRGA